jgi:hypothetical protein
MAEQYGNRSDLRNPATRQVRFTGQTYGEGAAQARSQQAVAPGSAPAQVQAQQMAAQQAPRPGARPLLRPTERPTEPVTAGANFGPGPNAQQAGIMPRQLPADDTMEQLRALYLAFPNEDLEDMLSKYEMRGY